MIPTVCIVEATYLVEKSRVDAQALLQLDLAVNAPGSAFEASPLTTEIAFRLSEIPRSTVPDLPDRIIAATALTLGMPLVTRDGKIRALNIATIW